LGVRIMLCRNIILIHDNTLRLSKFLYPKHNWGENVNGYKILQY
jgi:hypothetical protein